MRRILRYFIILACLKTLALSLPLAADVPPAALEDRKAGIVSQIPKQVTWQSQPKGDTFVFGVFGDKGLHQKIEERLIGSHFLGLPVKVRNVENIEQLNACQVLFVPLQGNSAWRAISRGEVRPGLLTIGESPDFIDQGGVVRIGPIVSTTIKPAIEIHRGNEKAAKLEIAFPLLRLATRVVTAEH